MSLWVSDNFGANQSNSLITRYKLVVKDKEKYDSLRGKLPNFDFSSFDVQTGSQNAELLKLFGFDGENLSSEFDRIYPVFSSLIDADLDKNTFRFAIEKMWPDFAAFFIEGMNCIEFKRNFSFDISHIKHTADVLANTFGYVPDEIVDLLEIGDVAHSNARVLNLVKKVCRRV